MRNRSNHMFNARPAEGLRVREGVLFYEPSRGTADVHLVCSKDQNSPNQGNLTLYLSLRGIPAVYCGCNNHGFPCWGLRVAASGEDETFKP